MSAPAMMALDALLHNHTAADGSVNWSALMQEAKSMAAAFMPEGAVPPRRHGMAMEEMMKKMAEQKKQGVEWQAQIGRNPLQDAFAVKTAAHAQGSMQMVPPPFVPFAAELLPGTARTTRSAVYINVPFCQTRCAFCMFYIAPYKKEESKRYADALIKEMRLWHGSKAAQSRPINAVYMGGGTPTALEAEDLGRIISACHELLPLANDCEFTVEGRLSFFDEVKIEACLKAGANRFSLGVQTFDTEIRRAVGRLSTQEELIAGLTRLASYDEAAVVIDLIFGLPGQTEETWQRDLKLTTELPIHGVDLYQLIMLENSPLARRAQSGRCAPVPDARKRALMYQSGCEAMQRAHWRQISASHFARNTRERNLYNVLAKSDADTLAFGPGAGGKLQGLSFMNSRSYEDYLRKVEAGCRPVAMMFAPADDRWRLYKDIGEQFELGALNFQEMSRRHGVDLQECAGEVFTQWQQAGLLELHGAWADLTLAGRFWAVTMTQLLVDYLQQKQAAAKV